MCQGVDPVQSVETGEHGVEIFEVAKVAALLVRIGT